MNDNIYTMRQCPLCGEMYGKPPAISRTDNETKICPACGARQALAALNISEAEIEKTIEVMRKHNAI